MFNAVISKYEENGDGFTIYFESESEDKHMYTSVLRFLSESEMKKYRSSTKNRILTFRDAKKVTEYLT